MKNLIRLLILIAFALEGCKFNTSEVIRGSKIDDATLTEINNLDVKVFQDMQLSDYDAFSKLIAASLKKEMGEKGNMEVWKNLARVLAHKSYRMYDEINVSSLVPGYNLRVHSFDTSDNAIISLTTTCRETEISFLMLEDSVSQFLLAAVYGKYNGKWLLSGFSLGCYSYLGRTAPAYYNRAKQFYEQGDLVDAVVNISMCSTCLHPCQTLLKYKKAATMEKLTEQIIDDAKAKYHFPFKLENIKSAPMISGVQPERLGHEVVPEIDYSTKIKISDTLALRQENKEVQKSVGALFQGIKDSNMHIFYRVSCPSPANDPLPNLYNFVETTGSQHKSH